MTATAVIVLLAWALGVLAIAATTGLWWAVGAAPVLGALLWLEHRDLTRA